MLEPFPEVVQIERERIAEAVRAWLVSRLSDYDLCLVLGISPYDWNLLIQEKQAQDEVTRAAAMADREAAVKSANEAGMVKALQKLKDYYIDEGGSIGPATWSDILRSLNLPPEALRELGIEVK